MASDGVDHAFLIDTKVAREPCAACCVTAVHAFPVIDH
jgi:hypothetical protein